MTTPTLILARDALKIGRDAAFETAQEYHSRMAGYRLARHAALDADVAKIDEALAAIEAELASMGADDERGDDRAALEQLRIALDDFDSLEETGPTSGAVLDAALRWRLTKPARAQVAQGDEVEARAEAQAEFDAEFDAEYSHAMYDSFREKYPDGHPLSGEYIEHSVHDMWRSWCQSREYHRKAQEGGQP
jgi:hypothetical protein